MEAPQSCSGRAEHLVPQPAFPGWSEYHSLFSSQQVIWLNHAGVSPISRPVAEAMQTYTEDVLDYGAARIADWYGLIRSVKRLAGALLGCGLPDLSITPNTTHGVNLVANGLRWKEGDEILLCNKEYPANVYPWWAQQSKGARLVWVEARADGRIPVEDYAARMTDRTRVVAVSHVQFSSGYRHNLAALGEACRRHGALLFVDAIQSFGVFDIHIEDWGVDALTTGAHKWLLGPTGIALFYSSPRLREQMDITWVGADSMTDALDYLDYKFELLPDGRCFENACLNFAGIAGLRAALEVVQRFGREGIESQIYEATERLSHLLSPFGFAIHSPRGEDEWSGILSVTHPDHTPESLSSRLKAQGIITSVRDHRWRLSPHAYHDEEQFETIIEAIKEAAAG
jgi:selenocysteine lyase/cysteine desulfurase